MGVFNWHFYAISNKKSNPKEKQMNKMNEETRINCTPKNKPLESQLDQEDIMLLITACGGSKKIAEELLKWYTI